MGVAAHQPPSRREPSFRTYPPATGGLWARTGNIFPPCAICRIEAFSPAKAFARTVSLRSSANRGAPDTKPPLRRPASPPNRHFFRADPVQDHHAGSVGVARPDFQPLEVCPPSASQRVLRSASANGGHRHGRSISPVIPPQGRCRFSASARCIATWVPEVLPPSP